MEGNAKWKGFWRPLTATVAAGPALTLKLAPVLMMALTMALTLAFSQAAWTQEKKVYRWVDEDGNVHYSESLPPDFQSETHDEMRGDGIVTEEGVSRLPPPPVEEQETKVDKGELPRDKSGLKRPEPLYSDSERQQRMDRLLLLRYHSEDELVEAMEVEINQLKYDEQLLAATRGSLESSLKSAIDEAGHRQRAGLEVSDQLIVRISNLRARLGENERSLMGLEKRENKIRDSFNRDIERYRELVETYSEAEEES